ncbi:pilin [Luteimonas sp. SMYT11W]|uniref:Pilin n=1 Tax=Luteimonas flava TaxID=3115822 RepID=A0ABU7WIR4_9GAMM
MQGSRGFSLIELMIVVAIIALLAAIAIPSYQEYVVRGQVAEGFSLAEDARIAVVTFHAEQQGYPAGNLDAGLSAPGSIAGRYVTAVELRPGGQVEITFGNRASARIQGQTLSMTMTDEGGSLHWTCAGLSKHYVPSACR